MSEAGCSWLRCSTCSRRVVGWACNAINDTELALAALQHAVKQRRPPPGLVHHSDRGSPYASARYRAALAHHGMVASMSRKGDCWDNAVAESFFSTLKAELTERVIYATRAEATRSIGEYIDNFYNLEHRHAFIGLCQSHRVRIALRFELRQFIRKLSTKSGSLTAAARTSAPCLGLPTK